MPHLHESSSSPIPKPPASEEAGERTERIRIKNRRKFYLDRHPSYFQSPDLELADPLLYDRCIRRFQSAAEREADGKAKGYSGVLEADLYRSEAKIAALHQHDPKHISSSYSSRPPAGGDGLDLPSVSYVRDEKGEIVPEEEDEVPKSKEEGLERWKFEMTLRFLRGGDDQFEYKEVDESEEWDLVEGREEEEKWFEDEEPEWVSGDEGDGMKSKTGTGGETGIQDF